jgi:hypothetical protein
VVAKPIRWTAVLVLVLLAAPAAAGAECVTVQLPKGERIDLDRLTVSFDVDRVWTGRLRKAAKLVVAGDGPVLLAESGAELKRLGRGRAPLP